MNYYELNHLLYHPGQRLFCAVASRPCTGKRFEKSQPWLLGRLSISLLSDLFTVFMNYYELNHLLYHPGQRLFCAVASRPCTGKRFEKSQPWLLGRLSISLLSDLFTVFMNYYELNHLLYHPGQRLFCAVASRPCTGKRFEKSQPWLLGRLSISLLSDLFTVFL